jgi:CCR4-NOT complex subunit CAF16
MQTLQADYPERRDILMRILEINPNWRMHMVSDGQRRRVQMFFGLLRPYKILLMDEVTISLDALVRWNILQWIKEDIQERNAVCIYATHIFDGMNEWASHVMYINAKGHLDFYDKCDFDIYPKFLEWLRKEEHQSEPANGEHAITNISSQQSAGGYAHGRLETSI